MPGHVKLIAALCLTACMPGGAPTAQLPPALDSVTTHSQTENRPPSARSLAASPGRTNSVALHVRLLPEFEAAVSGIPSPLTVVIDRVVGYSLAFPVAVAVGDTLHLMMAAMQGPGQQELDRSEGAAYYVEVQKIVEYAPMKGDKLPFGTAYIFRQLED